MMEKELLSQLMEMTKQLSEITVQLQELSMQNRLLREENEYLKKKLFGTKSETKKSLGYDQASLFNEAEVEFDETREEYKVVKEHQRRKKQKGFIEEKFKNIPHEKVLYDLPESMKQCPRCKTELSKVGEEFLRYEFEFVPAQLKVKEIYVATYECRKCRKVEKKSVMVTAGSPEPVIPHSYASPESVAQVMKEKFVNGVPLYRQEDEWKRLGVELSRATMASWVIKASELWLQPLVEHMHQELLKGKYVHSDETPVQVLKEPGKKATSKSYMWVYASIKEAEHNIRIFDYRPNRSGDNPQEFLKGFNGYNISDAYAGYNNLEGVTNVYCWAHVRRKFVDSLPKDMDDINSTLAKQAIDKIGKLFEIEKTIEKYSADEKKEYRKKNSLPILTEFFTWCDDNILKTLSGTKIYKALSYALNHKEGLCEYINDGYLPMTNSLDERTIRPFAIGRKNWLFSTSVDGAKSSAVAYSIVSTAKANGVDPYKYLTYVFRQMPGSDFKKHPEILEHMMPWDSKIQELCKNTL